MGKLKFGIIGNGSIAKKHINLIKKKFPNAEINVLAHKKKFKSKFDLRIFYKDKTFFKINYDFIFICNPSIRHVEYIKKCLKYKIKNIFVEKPLSDNFNDIKKLIKEYPDVKKKVLVGYVLLFNKLFIKTLKLIKQKKLGEIISATIVCNSNFKKWRKDTKFYKTVSANKNLGGGVLNELSHEINYAINLFGPVKKVFAKLYYKDKKKIDVESEAKIICSSKKNFNFGIFINFLSNQEDRYCEIIGTKANLFLDFKNKLLYLNKKKILYDTKKNNDQMYDCQLKFLINKDNKNTIFEKFNNSIETSKLIKMIRLSQKKNKIMRLI